jgi:DNA-binding MarR family transcriptional regulator
MADTTIEKLQELGFGQYEAQAYVALLQSLPCSGYELARLSGVPRASLYGVLEKLEQRGAVLRLETPAGTRYAAVPPEQVIQRLQARLQFHLDEARQSLCQLQAAGEEEPVWNARGYPALLEHAQALIDQAQEQLLLAVSPPEAPALVESLERAVAREVEITTLCLAGCPHECGACRGRIFRYITAPQDGARSLLVVPDGKEVLAGEIRGVEQAQAVRTRQRLLVELASRHIRDRIALAAILLDLDGKLEGLLKPETRNVLAALGPCGEQPGWLEEMQRLLKSPPK